MKTLILILLCLIAALVWTPAAAQHAHRPQRASQTVIWGGAASYPGYRGKQSQSSQRAGPPRPPPPYVQQSQSSYRRVQHVPLRSQRAKDARYREGLQDLAGLM